MQAVFFFIIITLRIRSIGSRRAVGHPELSDGSDSVSVQTSEGNDGPPPGNGVTSITAMLQRRETLMQCDTRYIVRSGVTLCHWQRWYRVHWLGLTTQICPCGRRRTRSSSRVTRGSRRRPPSSRPPPQKTSGAKTQVRPPNPDQRPWGFSSCLCVSSTHTMQYHVFQCMHSRTHTYTHLHTHTDAHTR